jgi:4-hydroxy-tetrahydrodipicolinate reductase
VKLSDSLGSIIDNADVRIDFTSPASTMENIRLASTKGKAMVIGTTGLSKDEIKEIEILSKKIPCVVASNMSTGVNLLLKILQDVARVLGDEYDIEIVESHHRLKKDAPSGTAKRLIELLALARKQKPEAIVAHAIRAGDIVGDHTVIFAGPAERIELTHRAHSREVFAQGALKAAQFVVRQKPGLYDMSDVLRA